MLDKKYNHKQVEEGKYEFWLDNNYFKSGDKSKKPFCIVIPPPNVTGKLHLGHAWDNTLQDIIIRYKRMDGYDALYLPGMDHAGIATQAKVDKKLRGEGIDPRSLDRNTWLEHAWSWKDEYAENIHNQWKKLGLSLDYSKERFTLDEGLSDYVKKVFVDLYNEGLIYRGERIINWDPEAMTALSNEEVIYKEDKGAFYHIKYMFEDGSGYLDIATTRPETLFGDVAVIVNPDDDRYKDYIGRNVILPIVGRKIPVIADSHADMETGSGCVKITPSHDINDFEVGNRHNLERITVINKDGTMNDNALDYSGLDRFECREKLVDDLQKQNLLIRIEEITHSVGHSERTDAVVEPYLSRQWFVKMRPLADKVLEYQKTNDKVNFVPARFEKIVTHWMTITYDWCISRQLWWGHRIPAWYKNDEVYVSVNPPEGEGWIQDEDVLDTWFSSALWPFSTLNYLDEESDLRRYYPTNTLVTGYDIIPFWVCRMIFQGLKFTDKKPFNDCLIHGLIRDKDGRKMSKSLGNGVDPMDVIEEYGCDALRFFISTQTAPGIDLRYDEEKLKSTWNFINKLWNASRYVLMNLENFKEDDYSLDNLSNIDKWILNKLNNTIKTVRRHMEKYDYQVVGSELYNFFWNDFCDWYIELSKVNANNSTLSTLYYVLLNILKLLHPFMPYVTEEIYQSLPFKKFDSIVISDYPIYNKEFEFNTKDTDNLIELIKEIRFKKQDGNMKDVVLVFNDSNSEFISEYKPYLEKLLKLNGKVLSKFDNSEYDVLELTLSFSKFSIYYTKNINKEEELTNLNKEKDNLINSIKRREGLLNNVGYVTKAPAHLVEEERKKLALEKEKLEIVLANLSKNN